MSTIETCYDVYIILNCGWKHIYGTAADGAIKELSFSSSKAQLNFWTYFEYKQQHSDQHDRPPLSLKTASHGRPRCNHITQSLHVLSASTAWYSSRDTLGDDHRSVVTHHYSKTCWDQRESCAKIGWGPRPLQCRVTWFHKLPGNPSHCSRCVDKPGPWGILAVLLCSILCRRR